jgi:hypothetical protein
MAIGTPEITRQEAQTTQVQVPTTTNCHKDKDPNTLDTDLGQSETIIKAIKQLKEKKITGLKGTMKALKSEEIGIGIQKEITKSLRDWTLSAKAPEDKAILIRTLTNWVSNKGKKDWKTAVRVVFQLLRKGIEEDKGLQKHVKMFLNKSINNQIDIVKIWKGVLAEAREPISNRNVAKWISDWAQRATSPQKQQWESFIAEHVKDVTMITQTTDQSCEITIRSPDNDTKVQGDPERIAVWNGNGTRARWAGTEELKKVVHATNPDILCFLEAKTDIANLLKLEGFEEWVQKIGFRHIYCHWSVRTDDSRVKAYGNEGIIVFSKVPCLKATYGTGNREFDQQARIVQMEFRDTVFVFTYNPQGGFTTQSLD